MELKKIEWLLEERRSHLFENKSGSKKVTLSEEGILALEEIKKSLKRRTKLIDFEKYQFLYFTKSLDAICEKVKNRITWLCEAGGVYLKTEPVEIKSIDELFDFMSDWEAFDLSNLKIDKIRYPELMPERIEGYGVNVSYTLMCAQMSGRDIAKKFEPISLKWEEGNKILEEISVGEAPSFFNEGVTKYTSEQKEAAIACLDKTPYLGFDDDFGSEMLKEALDIGKYLIKKLSK